MMDALRDLWGLALAAVAGLVWLVRLEGRIGGLERQIEADRQATRESRKETNDLLREVQRDIKRLLEKTGTPPAA